MFVPAFVMDVAEVGGTWPIALMACVATLRYAYFVYFEHGKGQTIGKWLFKIRVRGEREDKLPLKEALVRNIIRFDVLLSLAYPDDLNTANTAARLVVALALFYSTVAPIFIWQSEKKQRPLDMLMHTVVVRTDQPQTQARS